MQNCDFLARAAREKASPGKEKPRAENALGDFREPQQNLGVPDLDISWDPRTAEGFQGFLEDFWCGGNNRPPLEFNSWRDCWRGHVQRGGGYS